MVLVPCLIISVLVIIALPKKDRYIIDMEGDLDAYQDPELVNNSDIGFFYKNEQLTEYRNQKKPDKANVIKMSENIVTSDFTKKEVSILPSAQTSYTGPTNLVMVNGEVLEYITRTDSEFVLKGGGTVSKEDSFEIILDTGVWGSNASLPHRIEQVNKYYCAFTEEKQAVYFEFTSSNEFASIRISEISGNLQYKLLDGDMKELKNGWNNSSSTIDVQYKGRGSATYYLKVIGSFSETLKPFCVEMPSDSNEWMWQMVYADADTEITGKTDYYGDEDFFVLPEKILGNMDKSVITFTSIPADINIVIYDRDKNILAQYLQKKDAKTPVSLYALKDAYAMSVYSYDGASSGADYSFMLSYIDTVILDIQTYGFALTPGYSDEIDYYTATVSSPLGKQITEIMTTTPTQELTIKVTQQCGYEYYAKVGQELDLGYGRNTVTISFTTDTETKEIVIVISYKTDKVYYGYTTSGKAVFVVDDNPENNLVMIEKENGNTEKIKRTELYTYVETQMPESYREKIEALQAAHPNWKFTFVNTGYDFESYVDSQDRLEDGVPVATINGTRATREQIEFYVDPRNFLTEQGVFMFEKQTYTEGIYSSNGMASIWSEKEEAVLSEETFISYFTEAGKSAGISPYFITARAGLESGHGTSKLALGQITGCEGYYNYYGINATNANPSGGGTWAKEHNWNTRRKAIIEGAAWIKNQYIGRMQYSAYFMKFCFIPTRTWHQYMTDLKAPYSSAQDYYKAHANGGTLDDAIEFVIPVFSNMP